MIEQFANDPYLLGGAVLVFLGLIAYRWKSDRNLKDSISPESMRERLYAVFREPVLSRGSKLKQKVWIRSTSAAPQFMGYAVRAKDGDVTLLKLQDPEEKDGKYEAETVSGTTYAILPGTNKWRVALKYWFIRIINISYLKRRVLEVYDTPSRHIQPSEDGIIFGHKTWFVKYNGVYRVVTPEGMSRVWDMTFSKLHENYLETKQNIPEQYATLNNRISGQLKKENIKSENIRKYMKAEKESEKRSAMQD